MAVPVPRLDDRDYPALVEELRARIPALTPEWTDVGPADPGRTLLELMAFLGESVLYRFNQLPEAAWAQVLRLLDVPLRAAVPATGLVTVGFSGPPPLASWQTVEASTIVRAGAVEFSTRDDVTVLPLRAEAVIKRQSTGPVDADLQAEAEAALDAIGAGTAEPAFYETAGLAADPAQARTRPLLLADAVDRALWIALRSDLEDRAPLLDPQHPSGLPGQLVSIGVWTDAPETSMSASTPCPGWNPLTGTGVQVSWVVSTVLGTDETPSFVPVEVVRDLTSGLQQSGVVRLRLPSRPDLGVPVPPADGDGSGDFPPTVDDPGTVVCWLRALPVSGTAAIAPLTWVAANATRVVQASAAEAEYLGTGTGNPDQIYPMAHHQVQPELREVVLDVEESTGEWVTWTRVSSLADGVRTDRHWALDAEAGQARFGDTVRARVPQPGQRIRIRPYVFGGGREGNLPAKALTVIEPAHPLPGLTVSNPLPTSGGVAAESLGEGLDKVPGEFRRRDRAVTASDFTELAEGTPGGEVVRAECLPRFDPRNQATEAAGLVTVVVWPRVDADHPEAPRPSRTLIGRVCRHLDERRLVTTELFVVAPTYRRVGVSLAVVVKPGYSPDGVRRWSEQVLRQYLAPVPPYGPSGRGWPLGRRVFAPELEAAVLQVEGIEYVSELLVAEDVGDPGVVWRPGPVLLEPWEVVELTAVTVVVGEQAGPVGILPTASPPGGVRPVPVPVPRRPTRCCS